MKIKKLYIYFISLFLSIITTCNFSLGLYGRQYTKYEIPINKNIKVSKVVINGTKIPLFLCTYYLLQQ